MIFMTLHAFAERRAPRAKEYLGALLASHRRNAREQRELRLNREAFLNLLRVDERALEDIGVTREDVDWAARLPLETNAALALRQRAARRRAEPAATPGR